MRIYSIVARCLFFIVSLCSTVSYAGSQTNILFSVQRHTYVEGEKSISIGLRNAEQQPYLIQANMMWLDEKTGKKDLTKKEETPFIVIPPLYKLMPNTYYEWRILFSGNPALLPKDRESVYFVRFLLIPPVESTQQDNKTNMLVLREFNFKIYFRPKTLEKLTITEVEDKVDIQYDGNQLIVRNQSPLFLSIDKITVGSVLINDEDLLKPLPPFGELRYSLPNGIVEKTTVKWNLLDEYAFSLKERTVEIN